MRALTVTCHEATVEMPVNYFQHERFK